MTKTKARVAALEYAMTVLRRHRAVAVADEPALAATIGRHIAELEDLADLLAKKKKEPPDMTDPTVLWRE